MLKDVASLQLVNAERFTRGGIDGGRVTIAREWRAALVIIIKPIVTQHIITAAMLPPDIISSRTRNCHAYPASLSFSNQVVWVNGLGGIGTNHVHIRSPSVPSSPPITVS
jgi:hypothetical protein